MATWKEHLTSMREEWVGARVKFEGKTYRVVEVDSNGALLIDKPAQFTDTTAVDVGMVTRMRMSYEEILDAAHSLAKAATIEQLVDGFEDIVKRGNLDKDMNLALYGAYRAELLGRLKGV